MSIQEFTPQDPTFVEAVAWTIRNISFAAAPAIVLFGDIDLNGELMEKGVGILAIGGICEVIRRAERKARQTPD